MEIRYHNKYTVSVSVTCHKTGFARFDDTLIKWRFIDKQLPFKGEEGARSEGC